MDDFGGGGPLARLSRSRGRALSRAGRIGRFCARRSWRDSGAAGRASGRLWPGSPVESRTACLSARLPSVRGVLVGLWRPECLRVSCEWLGLSVSYRAFPKDCATFAEGWIPSARERGMAVERSWMQSVVVAGDRGMGARVGVATRRGRGAREAAPVYIQW